MNEDAVLYEGDTELGHYIVVDTVYSGRPARVLYSGSRQAAQSGIAHDDKDELLFDYNQRFLELLRGLVPKRVLLIGGGAFTLPLAILEEFPRIELDIVELDAGLVKIAEEYFGFSPSKRTKVHIGDGRTFLDKNTRPYDLILIDAFLHDAVPRGLQTLETTQALKRNLREGGVVAMNIIAAYYGQRSEALRRQLAAFASEFQSVETYPVEHGQSLWIPQNFIVTAQEGRRGLAGHRRYQPLPPLRISPDDAITDGA